MSVINAVPLLAAAGGDYTISRSVRLRSSASAYFNRTLTTPTGTTKWTWSGWVKRGTLGASQTLFSGSSDVNNWGYFGFLSGDTLTFSQADAGSVTSTVTTTQVFRDPSAWYHIVVVFDSTQATAANRLLMYINGVQVTSFGTATYLSQNTASRINTANPHQLGRYFSAANYLDGYMTEINFIDGQALTPSSFGENDAVTGVWKPKKYAGTYGTNGFYLPFSDNSSLNGIGGTSTINYGPGLGAWTVVNSLNAIPAGTVVQAIGVYQNSSESGKYAYILRSNGSNSYTVVASTASFTHNGTGLEYFALTSPYTIPGTGTYYLAVYCPGSGLQWGHDSNSSTTWEYYAGSVSGTQTFTVYSSAYYQPALIWRTANALTNDVSGNKNYWQGNNISLTAGSTYDSMLDVPTNWADGGNGRGNYAVLNPLSLGSTVTLSNANLTMTEVGTYATTVSSIAMTSGKWYAEMTVGSNTYAGTCGIARLGYAPTSRLGFQSNTWSYNYDGGLYYNSTTLAGASTFTTGDVIGIAFDADNLTITFYKNGVQQSNQYTSANSGLTAGEFYFATGHINSTSNWNFGQRPFAYTPPTGFKALNTQNLPDSTIKRGSDYFDIVTRAGTGASAAISSYRFAPDFVWVKARTNAYYHKLLDKIRGANKVLASNATDAEITETQGLMSFDTNGYTLGTSSDSTVNNAGSGQTYVDWAWKKGATPGFDIVTYTGNGGTQNISHNLGVAPRMMIVKKRSTTGNWPVYHASLGNATSPFLNLTNAANSQPNLWNSTTPTSSVFTVGSDAETNANTATFVAYLFSEVAGFSRMGSYQGNGSSDGPFVFCGFRPRFVMVKRTDTTSDWTIWDTARDTYNVSVNRLFPNLSSAESTGVNFDITSNGFKLRDTGAAVNASGGTYIFAAFSETAFKFSLAR